MKKLNLTLILIALAVILGCEKDNKTPVTTEDLTNYKVFKIHAQQLSTGLPVSNYELYFKLFKTYHIPGSTQGVIRANNIIYTTKTDNNGNARFKIHKDSLTTDASIYVHKSYFIGGLENLTDSLSNMNSNWYYRCPPESYRVYFDSIQLISEIKYELLSHLNCPAQINLYGGNPIFPDMDSLIFSSNIVSNYKLNMYEVALNGIHTISWEIECNKTNKLNYYYRYKDFKSKVYSLEIDASKNQFVLDFK
ncbi:MAG: hypothetical protein ACEQSR_03010 [Candidatus Methylacidiphilales bacterium]